MGNLQRRTQLVHRSRWLVREHEYRARRSAVLWLGNSTHRRGLCVLVRPQISTKPISLYSQLGYYMPALTFMQPLPP